MPLYSDQTIVFQPMTSYYHVSNSSAASGWKTLTWANSEITNSGLTHSNGSFTVNGSQYAGYYYVTFNHLHTNGSHDNYWLRIYNSGLARCAYQRSKDGDGQGISCIMYLASGWTYSCAVYHGNSAHACSNADRCCRTSAFRLNNI